MSTTPTVSAAASPAVLATPTESLVLRIARSTVAITLVLALTFLGGLAVVGWVPVARESLAPLFSFTTKGVSIIAAVLTLAFIVITPTALFALASRRGRLKWSTLALGWTLAAGAFVWLATDEPHVRRPLTIEEIAPAFPGAEKSYAVLMHYSKRNPSEEAKAFANFKSAVTWGNATPREPEKWQDFITKNRAALEADWAAIAPQRRWLDEVNAFDRLGDTAPATFDAPIISFQVWRLLSQRAAAIASLQALDGRGDEALATILPYLETGRKLEPSARTLVRFMVARVVQRLAIETTTFILNRHTPGPAIRPRLVAALAGGNSGAGARRLVLLEYPAFAHTIATVSLADQHIIGNRNSAVTGPLALFSPFLFNPIATVNRYGDHLYELAGFAEARELGKFAVRGSGFADDLTRHGGPKNIGGSLLINLAIPALEKILKSYWEIEDLRIALQARVAALPR